MLPAHWKTLEPYLDEALDAAPAQRQALLARLQAQSPELAAQLADLLSKHDQAETDRFLQDEPPATGLFDTPLAGQRLGAYTLQQPIGEGGMGSVWLARRDDGRYEGQVAVKLLSLALAGASRAERFRREGQILARLAHPHIARLVDAGVSPSGQPYLVLEHVQGQHIDLYCNERQLGLQARVQLMLTLLDAVQHAHAHLVVHRDIKPSNVMVDGQGQLKLLDFGIAKLMTADGHTDVPLTQQAGTLLSPGYAAPEQLQSGDISTTTDVYALGVLLYVLLSGHHPTTRPGSSAAQALQDGLQRNAPLMSQAARGDDAAARCRGLRAAQLCRALTGDLDNIAAKALQREPSRRYATAATMAEDLRRHLAQQPVQARPPSLAYLLRRFAQRHRWPVAGAAASVLVAGALSGQAWQERQVARLNQARAQTVDGLLQSLFHGMGPDVAASRSFSARELLDRGQAFIDSRSDLDPATRRAARLRMAALYRDVGAYQESAAGFKAEAEEAHAAGDTTGRAMALWQWANVTLKQLDFPRTTQLLEDLHRAVTADRTASPGIHARMALLEGELALTQRRSDAARQALDRADALLAGTAEFELAARAAQAQAMTARLRGDLNAARGHLQRSATLQARRGDDAVVDRLAVALDLGGLENVAGLHGAAVRVLGPMHADMLARLGADHPLTVGAVSELALAELRQGHFEALQPWLAQLRGGTSSGDSWRDDHAAMLGALAMLYAGRATAAEPELRRVLTALLRDEGGPTPATEPVRRLHAEALLRLGRVAEAEAALRQAEANQMKLGQEGRPSLAATRLLLGVAEARRGDLASAAQRWRDAATVLDRELGPQHPYAVAAACYAALIDGDGPVRLKLAERLEQVLAWQDGAPALARLLRSTAPHKAWQSLPAVL